MPTKISKHGTLTGEDMEDAVPVDVDQVLAHYRTDSTAHLFGRSGSLPPKDAMVVERRYTPFWEIIDVGLTKVNSQAKGKFVVDLVEGEYKLSVKLNKNASSNPLTYASQPIGMLVGGVSSLVVSSDKREETFARGMPTDYVEVRVTVQAELYVLLDNKQEIDLGANDVLTRTFTVTPADGNTQMIIFCQSYSLLKRLRVQAELFRRDLPAKVNRSRTTRPCTVKEQAAIGRELVHRALSGGTVDAQQQSKSAGRPAPPPPPPPSAKLAKRKVALDPSIDVRSTLLMFYSDFSPEKVTQVDNIMQHFYKRDMSYGVLFATLEDKYSVKFNESGDWAIMD